MEELMSRATSKYINGDMSYKDITRRHMLKCGFAEATMAAAADVNTLRATELDCHRDAKELLYAYNFCEPMYIASVSRKPGRASGIPTTIKLDASLGSGSLGYELAQGSDSGSDSSNNIDKKSIDLLLISYHLPSGDVHAAAVFSLTVKPAARWAGYWLDLDQGQPVVTYNYTSSTIVQNTILANHGDGVEFKIWAAAVLLDGGSAQLKVAAMAEVTQRYSRPATKAQESD